MPFFFNIPEIEESIKASAVDELFKCGDPINFLTYNDHHRETLCKEAGLTGWSDRLKEEIEKSKGLPSPSQITYESVKLFVSERIRDPINITEVLAEDEEKRLMELWEFVQELCAQTSEADALFRLSAIILHLFQNNPRSGQYKINCQPTVKQHPVFTDILIEIVNGHKCLLIEAKRFSIATDISMETNETAQVFRETHIYLQHNKHLNEVPFVLTNSVVWESRSSGYLSSEN